MTLFYIEENWIEFSGKLNSEAYRFCDLKLASIHVRVAIF